MRFLNRTIIIVTAFAIAMGFLESAVVIYLREIMYPAGFGFPLSPIDPDLALTEILREMATLIMLITVALLAGKSFSQRFAWFLYSFAIWDIFYYVFLWLLIGWPESLMTWDVLFLIPVTWTGPIITPLILAMLMISFALMILRFSESGFTVAISKREWIGLIAGSVIVIVSFTTDYMRFMLSEFSFIEILSISDSSIIDHAQGYVPESFPWLIYLFGVIVISGTISAYYFRISKKAKEKR